MKNVNENQENGIEKLGKGIRNVILLAGLGASVAFIAGVVTGLMNAPKAGKDLRKEIEEKSTDLFGKAKEQINAFNKKMSPKVVDFAESMSRNAT